MQCKWSWVFDQRKMLCPLWQHWYCYPFWFMWQLYTMPSSVEIPNSFSLHHQHILANPILVQNNPLTKTSWNNSLPWPPHRTCPANIQFSIFPPLAAYFGHEATLSNHCVALSTNCTSLDFCNTYNATIAPLPTRKPLAVGISCIITRRLYWGD